LVTARDARPSSGRTTIEVRSVDLDESYTRSRAEARPGPHVLLAVSDTGTKMDAPTPSRAIEPFFATKGELGPGLGLATVHGIVKQNGGQVAVYSEPDCGATFKVYLPRIGGAAPSSADKSSPVLAGGHETILLVEDED